MKLNPLFALVAAGSLAFVACDKQTAALDEKTTELKAEANKKIDEAKDAAKEKAPAAAAAVDKVAADLSRLK